MHDQDGQRLFRYISGQSSAAERAEIEARIAADASFREQVRSLTAAWELSGAGAPSWDVDAGWQEFQRRRSAAARPQAVIVPVTSKRRALSWALRAAAAVVLLMGGALLWSRFSASDSSSGRAAQEFVAAAGERRAVRLVDGTSVTLAPASWLRLTPGFGTGAREVHLEGEAEFQVAHDARRPFRVHAGEAVTEVLGTHFVVRAYEGDAGTVVALVEGSVRLRAAHDNDPARALTLKPGQVARAAQGLVGIAENENVRAILAWTHGELAFVNTPLVEVVRELRRWYNVDIRLAADSIAQKRLTASFRSEPLEQVLELTTRALKLRYERRAGTIVFSAQ